MMKQSFIRLGVLTLFSCLCSAFLHSQVVTDERLFSFEAPKVPDCITSIHSQLSISDIHYKDGKHSMKWDFEPGGILELKKDLKFEKKDPTGKDLYLSAFIVWVYNEEPQNTTIEFEFLKDGRKCTSFPFGINFKGWRAAWVCYERDMQGTPQEGMNELRIVAPNSKGCLFIDHLITATKVDARQQTADLQVPFVNAGTNNHWLVVYKHSLLKPDIELTPVSDRQKKEMQLLEKRFRDMNYTKGKLSDKEVETIRKKYDFYQITYKNGQVSGVPIYMVRASEAYERIIPNWDKDMLTKLGIEMRAYFDLMKRIAVAYNNSAANPELQKEMKQKFLAMYDHITDQGVTYGSCWGNIHHYGYSVRGLYLAYFLMKDVLREAGKLQEAERTLRWYAITNEVYPKPEGNGIDMDSFNTQTTGRIASILMMEDTPEKLQYLRSFSRWIDYGCRPAPGLAGSFKIDGGAFHHRNNYPAYAVGGLDGATNMIYLFSRTEFAISKLAHETVRNVLFAMRFYCNKLNFPLSMSGRHPDGRGRLVPMHYAMMAMAGTSDGKSEFDKEMASAYLRLVSGISSKEQEPEYMPKVSNAQERKIAKLLVDNGFHPEPDPQGNLALGYGCVSVQRRSNWSAVARGHSRYLWAAEHYLGHNLYGRYLAHGSLQILTAAPGHIVTPATSGWQQEGFDWNRIPGVTSIHLPLEQLKAKVLNVDTFSGMEEMLYSDEAFAGGLSQKKENGNFGMKLHEHDKYNGSHRARKSFHFIGEMIVCLGSDIENTNTEYPTETTIFQLAVTDKAGHDYWKNYHGNGKTWIDHLGTGYYVPVTAKFEKAFPQYSRMQDTGKETKGDWISLVVNHGKAPKGGSYEYTVLPQTNETAMKSFGKKPAYKVLKQDCDAHIVYSPAENIYSYVLFETPQAPLPGELLQQTDTSCLVMVHKESPNELLLTVAQPDLALYRGASDEAFDKDGKRVERSIYSRPWINDESGEIPVTVTLKGYWNMKETPFCKVISADKKQTVLRFTCRDGASFEVELKKK
ncbi:chondroitinase family polysaccharide lyase [Bacteroides acidifaciens]|uniref:Chondroitin sulfate ABC exolyase n=1 Tax=Bacteroides acidifaciens TaxID=85831 RepID=A0A7J0A0Q6_9BACE|nr:chondroitinase family polysaccharide lyase [Bacteroides acidifaciens]GFH85609.1 chondroitin sulfate ABC exolyase [Bacteroides acidifaciens]